MTVISQTIMTVGLSGLALLLASCTVEAPHQPKAPIQHAAARPPVMELVARANPAAEARGSTVPRQVAQPWRPPKPKAPPKKVRSVFPVEISPEKLVGLSEYEVVALLGPDNARIISSPAQIIEYKFKQCHVTLYLYTNIETNIYTVLHVETKKTGRKSANKKRCVAMRTAAATRETLGTDAGARS